jgi:hypothetical protein
MKFLRTAFLLATAIVLGSNMAHATVSYTCDPTVSASVCTTLNTTIAGLYNSTFTNADANIYIQYGTTGLGESTTGYFNTISYAAYRSDLIAEAGSGLVRAEAIASLPITEPALYGGGDISITSALGTALGLTGLNGTTSTGALCTIGGAGCYNGIITVTNDPTTPLYYRTGGPEPADAYDYYTTVEHETDEVLGTSSCIDTQGPSLTNSCTGAGATASAVDLFRCGASGSHVLLDSTPGAYFSYNGCATNGAVGVGGTPKLYNTLANGDDYADFIASSPDCGTNQAVQDGTGCPGEDAGLDITNDGGAEINILDAVGYNLATSSTPAPEPMTLAIMLPGIAGLAALRRRRKAKTDQ